MNLVEIKDGTIINLDLVTAITENKLTAGDGSEVLETEIEMTSGETYVLPCGKAEFLSACGITCRKIQGDE